MVRRKRAQGGTKPVSVSDLRPGDLVPLADGPAANVLAGVDPVTGETYALKVYPTTLEPRVREDVTVELDRLARARAMAPVLVADRVVQHEGRAALRMELCEQSLPQLVASRGPLSVSDALALGEAVAAAVAAVHHVDVVHCGVTPSNVLFRASGEAVLSDGGTALRTAFPYGPHRDTTCLPPETLRDEVTSRAADIYGIGAVVYFALAGRPPHAGRGMSRIVDVTPQPLTRTDVPRQLAELLTTLLHHDPGARPPDAAEIAGWFARAVDTGTAPAVALAPVAPPEPAVPTGPTGFDVTVPSGPTEFDDFAAVPPPVRGRPEVFDDFSRPPGNPGRPPGRQLVAVVGAQAPRRTTLVAPIAAVVGLCLLVVAAVVMLANDPYTPGAPAAPPIVASETPAAPVGQDDVDVVLHPPRDEGEFVTLRWTSSAPLDFAVVVTDYRGISRAEVAYRNNSARVKVNPQRPYCFVVRGSNAEHTYESEPRGIRGALCR